MSKVRVKPLEWSQNWPNDALTAFAHAESINRTYTVDHDGPRFYTSTGLMLSDGWDDPLGNFGSIEDAKAAAQADFEQRILSAIEKAAP